MKMRIDAPSVRKELMSLAFAPVTHAADSFISN